MLIWIWYFFSTNILRTDNMSIELIHRVMNLYILGFSKKKKLTTFYENKSTSKFDMKSLSLWIVPFQWSPSEFSSPVTWITVIWLFSPFYIFKRKFRPLWNTGYKQKKKLRQKLISGLTNFAKVVEELEHWQDFERKKSRLFIIRNVVKLKIAIIQFQLAYCSTPLCNTTMHLRKCWHVQKAT